MSRNGEIDRPGLKISTDRLLLVEGRDEVNLFKALMEHCLDGDMRIQVIDAGGKDKFPKNLRAIRIASRTLPSLEAIGVVRDADDDARSAFRSVCDNLRNVGYDAPSAHGEFSDSVPSTGVFIIPDGVHTGAMETLCRRSQEGDAVSNCVEEYLKCLTDNDAMHSRNADKSFAHAYLAAMVDPLARVGEGARQGVWDFESPAFAALSGFLRDLASQGI